MTEQTAIWDRLFKTDPAATKPFTRAGGFKGTAIKPYWCIMRATQEFGPVGSGWGWTVHEDRLEEGVPGVKVWFSKVSVWYYHGGQRRETGPQWGATEFMGKNSKGPFTDEEAAKKSVTDALTKCLSYLGLAGDVHLGMFDDSKYVAELKDEQKPPVTPAEQKAVQKATEQKPPMYALDQCDGAIPMPRTANAFLTSLGKRLKSAEDPGEVWGVNMDEFMKLYEKARADGDAALMARCENAQKFANERIDEVNGKQAAE